MKKSCDSYGVRQELDVVAIIPVDATHRYATSRNSSKKFSQIPRTWKFLADECCWDLCKNRRELATRVRDGSESLRFFYIVLHCFLFCDKCSRRRDAYPASIVRIFLLFSFFIYRDYLSRVIIESENSPRSSSLVSIMAVWIVSQGSLSIKNRRWIWLTSNNAFKRMCH